jgi:PBP1b-binding outer membrane lipoprotein LpoB
MKRILLIAALLLLFSGCAHNSNNVKREFSIDVKQGNNYNVGPVVETSYKVTF